jgi:hypothetical protein
MDRLEFYRFFCDFQVVFDSALIKSPKEYCVPGNSKTIFFCNSYHFIHFIKCFNWSIVIGLVIDYTGFEGSFYININKKPW